jgi:hypothetical protein
MTQSQATQQRLQNKSEQQIHVEQLKRVELFNGRAAMVGIVIGIITEGLTGQGIIHQIGLGSILEHLVR